MILFVSFNTKIGPLGPAIEKPLMGTINIRLYDIFRKSFNLSESEAKEAVQVIEEVY